MMNYFSSFQGNSRILLLLFVIGFFLNFQRIYAAESSASVVKEIIADKDAVYGAIKKYADEIATKNIEKIVIVIGHVGEAKSTFQNLVAKKHLRVERVRSVPKIIVDDPVPGMDVGDGKLGVTKQPYYHVVGKTAFFDLPGFSDPKKNKELTNALAIYKTFDSFKNFPISVVLVSSEYAIIERSCFLAWVTTINAIAELFSNSAEDFCKALCLMVTKSRHWYKSPTGHEDTRTEIALGEEADIFTSEASKTIVAKLKGIQNIAYMPIAEVPGVYLAGQEGDTCRAKIMDALQATTPLRNVVINPSPSENSIKLVEKLIESISGEIEDFFKGTFLQGIVTFSKDKMDKGTDAQVVRKEFNTVFILVEAVEVDTQATLKDELTAVLAMMNQTWQQGDTVSDVAKSIEKKIAQHCKALRSTDPNKAQQSFVQLKDRLNKASVATHKTLAEKLQKVIDLLDLPDESDTFVESRLEYVNFLLLFKFSLPLPTWIAALAKSKDVLASLKSSPSSDLLDKDTHKVLVIKGLFLGLSDVQECFNKNNQAREINAYVSRIVYGDADLKAPSVSVCLIAPQWKNSGSHTIDLKGKNGDDASTNSGHADGCDGMAGVSGGNGGNFYGKCKEFVSGGDLLVVNSSGGSGGRGSDGNPGLNGNPGAHGDSVLGTQGPRDIHREFGETPVAERQMKHGPGGWYDRLWNYIIQEAVTHQLRISYVPITYNQQGQAGGAGGPGGKGGQSGKSGEPGQIVMAQLTHKVQAKEADEEAKKKNGKGGKGGQGGAGGCASEGERWTKLIIWDEPYKDNWSVPFHGVLVKSVQGDTGWVNIIQKTKAEDFPPGDIWIILKNLASQSNLVGYIDKVPPRVTGTSAAKGPDGQEQHELINSTSKEATPEIHSGDRKKEYDAWVTNQQKGALNDFILPIDS